MIDSLRAAFSASSSGQPLLFTPRVQPPRILVTNIICRQQKQACQPLAVQRRCILMAPVALPFLMPPKLLAKELLRTAHASSRQLPPGYEDFARKLTTALRDAIEADLSDAEERQVRKKAEPAKDLVKGWISRWKDQKGIESEVSYRQIQGTIRQLGDFYRQKGQRARLPRSLGDELLSNLTAAEESLPSSKSNSS